MNEIFNRTLRLIGPEAFERLQNAQIAVFGIGGVGSYTAEGLARSGIGSLTLIDSDVISPTNINRQIPATTNTVGLKKAEVMAERIKAINPDCKVLAIDVFYNSDTRDVLDLSKYDYIVDAIDTVSSKLLLIEQCTNKNVPIISSMGTGNKLDPTKFKISDIYKTSVCPLAKVIRHELKKRVIKKLKCLWSDEKPLTPYEVGFPEDSLKRNVPASISFVPSVAGLIISGEVIKDITGINK